MSALKQIFALVAVAALSYFAPGIGTFLAGQLGITSGFLASVIGSVVIAAGLYTIQSLFLSPNRGSDMEAGKVNVRIPEPPRWLCAGLVRQGGSVLFAEFDSAGNLWFLVVHSDSILTSTDQIYLDHIPVTLDGSGNVRNPEFRLASNKEKDPVTAMDAGDPYIQIWTTTYSESNPTPSRIAALDAAFASAWTSDHKLVGTTFSVVKMTTLPIEHRYKIYKWRGPLGMGEPAISVAGDWSNVYDPRDITQTLGDRTTYKPSRNAALIWAWFRTHRYGRRKSEASIDWDEIANQADICDEVITGLDGDTARYECGIAIPENKGRAAAEREIMLTMDGQIVFNEDGKTWCRAGAYYVPTLTLHRNRDIVAMESVEAVNGESETHGVVVRYTDPDADYTVQPSAAWHNPIYYDAAQSPQFLTVDIPAIHNHNQAMRVAKGIGMRSQPLHKIAPIMGLRGLRARQERVVELIYDNTFAGDYEIVTPVELDAVGIFCAAGMVPINSNRWNLLPGEEAAKPVVNTSETAPSYPAVTFTSLTYASGLLTLTLGALPRTDATYIADFIVTTDITGGDDPWLPMNFTGSVAVGGPVVEGTGYTVRYRYVTSSGHGPAWATQTITPTITIDPPNSFTVDDGTGQVILNWRNPTDPRFSYVVGYENTVDTFGTASDITGPQYGGLGAVDSYTRTVAAGTRYYWVRAFDGSGNSSVVIGSDTGISS